MLEIARTILAAWFGYVGFSGMQITLRAIGERQTKLATRALLLTEPFAALVLGALIATWGKL